MNMTIETRNAKASRGVIIVAMTAITLLAGSTTAQERPESVLTDRKRDRYLLLDSRIIETVENVKLTESELITKTVTDAEVQWKGGFSLKKLRGKQIKLRFDLRDAKLYSFSFID